MILDGKRVRDEIKKALQKKVAAFSSRPQLVIVQIGDHGASDTYIKQKKLFGEEIGVSVEHLHLEASVSESAVLGEISARNRDKSVHGVIVQMPIPARLDRSRIMDAIAPEKDVDGLGSASVKALWENRKDGFVPATTKGILSLLSFYQIPVSGKHVVVVGRSSLVGKPTAQALLNADATVTIAHSKTQNPSHITRSGDILIVAAGKPHFIQEDDVSKGQVVIDVGITAVTGEKLDEELSEKTITGDVHFDAVKNIIAAISPVPGGVGPMTVASLFQNLVEAYERQTV